MTTTTTTFGARLRELREAAGLTVTALAARAGLHRVHYQNLESGRRLPDFSTLQRLAAALDLDLGPFAGIEIRERKGKIPSEST